MNRSFHFLPADNESFMKKANNLKADVLIFDLEDSVGNENKLLARANICNFTNSTHKELFIRINSKNSNWFNEDIDLVNQLGEGIGVVIPKVESKDDILEVISKLRKPNIKIIALIESFRSLNLCDTFLSIENLVGTGLGIEDMLVEVPYLNENIEALIDDLRLNLLKKARAHDIIPIDTISTTFEKVEDFKNICVKAQQMGYTGKFSIHPNQIEIINSVLNPSKQEIDWSDNILNCSIDENSGYMMHPSGTLITPPKIKKATNIRRYE